MTASTVRDLLAARVAAQGFRLIRTAQPLDGFPYAILDPATDTLLQEPLTLEGVAEVCDELEARPRDDGEQKVVYNHDGIAADGTLDYERYLVLFRRHGRLHCVPDGIHGIALTLYSSIFDELPKNAQLLVVALHELSRAFYDASDDCQTTVELRAKGDA